MRDDRFWQDRLPNSFESHDRYEDEREREALAREPKDIGETSGYQAVNRLERFQHRNQGEVRVVPAESSHELPPINRRVPEPRLQFYDPPGVAREPEQARLPLRDVSIGAGAATCAKCGRVFKSPNEYRYRGVDGAAICRKPCREAR